MRDLLRRGQLFFDDDVVLKPLHALYIACDLAGAFFLDWMIHEAGQMNISSECGDIDSAGFEN